MTQPSRPARPAARVVAAVAGLVLAATALAGCAGTPGAAATVGDAIISEQTLTDAVAELGPGTGAAGQGADASIATSLLSRLIIIELVGQVAAQHGVNVAEGQVAHELAGYMQQYGDRAAVYEMFAQQGVPASQVDPMLKVAVQVTALGPILKPDGSPEEQTMAVVQAVTELGDGEGVQVNPRWGTWDPTTLNLGPTPDDLSTVPTAPAGS